jgi:hypothetical protein
MVLVWTVQTPLRSEYKGIILYNLNAATFSRSKRRRFNKVMEFKRLEARRCRRGIKSHMGIPHLRIDSLLKKVSYQLHSLAR